MIFAIFKIIQEFDIFGEFLALFDEILLDSLG